MNKLTGISFKEIFEGLMNVKKTNYKVLHSISSSIQDHAELITKGGSEFILNKEWLGIYWPPGEYEYIKLLKENKLDEFYNECENYFSSYEINKNYKKLLNECININKAMMRQPFQSKNILIKSNYNIIECYEQIKQSLDFKIVNMENEYLIVKDDFIYDNWDDWMREVIWYGHRSGKYTCKIINKNSNNQIKNNYEKSSNVIGNSYIV